MKNQPQQSGSSPATGGTGAASSNAIVGEAEFKGRLFDEYKILQDKIDKIGAFRFTIKGWSVTALVAASAAGSATTSLMTVFVISAGLALMLSFFFLFEFEQVKLSRIFGERARRLEGSFRLIDKGVGRRMAQIPVPYTAHETVLALKEQRLFQWRIFGTVPSKIKFIERLENWWRVIIHADIFFYFILVCLAFLLPLLPRHRAIGERWKDWTNRGNYSTAPLTTLPAKPGNGTAIPTIVPKTSPTPTTVQP